MLEQVDGANRRDAACELLCARSVPLLSRLLVEHDVA
jgi:hypothetical protein